MELRVIKSEDDYHFVLQEAERLVARDPAAGSKDADRLELLTVLIEDYEHRQFPFETPDPIEAIEFRMHEQGLRQRDLVPLIGSRSRVGGPCQKATAYRADDSGFIYWAGDTPRSAGF